MQFNKYTHTHPPSHEHVLHPYFSQILLNYTTMSREPKIETRSEYKSKHVVNIKHGKKRNCNSFCQHYNNTITLCCTQEVHFIVQDCSMTIFSYIITIILFWNIVLYSIKRDWPPCKVVFRVGNQNTKCDKQQQSNAFVKNLVTSSTGMYRASSL